MRRLLVICALSTSFVVATALPAFAHAGFVQENAPADSDQTLTLRVPGERTGQRTMMIETKVPAAFDVTSCIAPPNFSCSVGANTDSSTILSFTRTGGVADTTVLYSFAVRTPASIGSYPFPTIQTYDGVDDEGNTEEFWTGELSPTLAITEDGAPIIESNDPQEHESDPDTAPTQKPAPEPTPTPAPEPTNEADSADDSSATDASGPTTTEPVDTAPRSTTDADSADSDSDSDSTVNNSAAPTTANPIASITTSVTDPQRAGLTTDAADPTELATDVATIEDDGVLLPAVVGLLILGGGAGFVVRRRMQA